MEEYIVSARKYRPLSFDSVIGQQALTTTLKNAVKSGKLAHAYLFCGPRGVGKTTCARIFAKTINCSNITTNGEACNECESCKAFNEGRSYNILELDAASNNSVENIKSLMEQTRIPPQMGRYKIFIIDEVHMLSTAAFNAFLKTLEEPPAHVIFILATTEKHKILPTILSRCQIYDFERMTVENIVNHLKNVAAKENITYEEAALNIIAEKADGGMRDALSIFDQVASFSQGNITYQNVIKDLNVLDIENYFKIIDFSLKNNVSEIMLLINNLLNKGFDGGHLINGLAEHVRNVLMAKDQQTLSLLDCSANFRERYQEQAKKCPIKFLYKTIELTNKCDIQYKQSSNKRLLIELTLIQIAQITQEDDKLPSGRSPKRLKSLFKNLTVKTHKSKVVQQVTTMSDITAKNTENKDSYSNNKTSVAKNKISLGGLGMSFNNLRNEKYPKNNIKETFDITNKEEKCFFAQEELSIEWKKMCSRIEKNNIGLAQRMRNLKPIVKECPNIEVIANNKILLDEMTAIKGRIRKTMANELHNGNITIKFKLAKPDEIKKILTPWEELENMKKENEAVNELIKQLGLEIA